MKQIRDKNTEKRLCHGKLFKQSSYCILTHVATSCTVVSRIDWIMTNPPRRAKCRQAYPVNRFLLTHTFMLPKTDIRYLGEKIATHLAAIELAFSSPYHCPLDDDTTGARKSSKIEAELTG